MKARLVVFDLDGTLLDTVKDLGEATNFALKSCGYPERPVKDYYLLCGRGIRNLLAAAVPGGTEDAGVIGRLSSYFFPYYDAHKCDNTLPYPGIREMLRKVTSAGVLVALASNKYQRGAEELVKHFFGDIPFLKISGQMDGQPIKPSPEIVDNIIAAADGVDKKDVIYCGDSNVDMQTGINAGVRTVGVTWGFRSREELEAFKPWKIVDTAEELTRCILAPES